MDHTTLAPRGSTALFEGREHGLREGGKGLVREQCNPDHWFESRARHAMMQLEEQLSSWIWADWSAGVAGATGVGGEPSYH